MRTILGVSVKAMLALCAVALTTAWSPEVLAGKYFVDGQSIASELLVSRTQVRILRVDDRVDGACSQRKFITARVVKAPVIRASAGSIEERKWQEYWVLDRCGTQVGYWVFFTEVGDGGAYFSILENY